VSGELPLGTALFGFLYRADREQALRKIAESGYGFVELSATPPFLDLTDVSAAERREIRSQLERYELRCVSINPVELNPISTNRELAAACYHQYRTAIELTAELGGETVVMITGRRSPLIPIAEQDARDLLRGHLTRLAAVGERLGVTIGLEPVPYGFLQTAVDVAEFIEESGISGVGLTLDCANSFFVGADPAAEVDAAGDHLKLVHISDSWADRWSHTQVGTAEVDLPAFAQALQRRAFEGPTIYELVDGEDPAPRLLGDRERLSEWGWST
jgi:sugar phosphate isomerase/epimerase